MPEVMFAGPDGRLEGRYHHSKEQNAPVALILHPHPLHGGTMNNRITYSMYQAFQKLGCSVMRFNFRGVGTSEGQHDGGEGGSVGLDAGSQSRPWRIVDRRLLVRRLHRYAVADATSGDLGLGQRRTARQPL